MAWHFVRNFIRLESFAGILLVLAAAAGFIIANSAWAPFYQAGLYQPIPLPHFFSAGSLNSNLIINDGLMVLFFLLVGLEIKREIAIGELNSKSKIALPGIAAAGGMLVPAIIYLLITQQHPDLWRGWGIPTATDIAFALGVLNLLGARIPFSLKIFLMALAIFDDLGAILIIAFFYTQTLHWLYLGYAAFLLLGLIALNRYRIPHLWCYGLLGTGLWWCILQSGVHATVAGVLLALCIPLQGRTPHAPSPLKVLETRLHPWVALGIIPLFAFANTGVPLQGFHFATLWQPLPLGIALALLLGKQLGVFGAAFTAIRLRWSPMPAQATWRQLYGVALLCGIGFTMSLFIATLAFAHPAHLVLARSGILAGSLLAGLLGYLLIRSQKSEERRQN